jgi:hypothetical protein
MWNVKAIIGATGTISKSLRQYQSNIPRKHEMEEIQRAAILAPAHTLRKVFKSTKQILLAK